MAKIVRRLVFVDFGNVMHFNRGKATGMATVSRAMFHDYGCPEHRYCKGNVVHHVVEDFGIKPEDLLSVRHGQNDICMFRATGKSVAFRPKAAETSMGAQTALNSALSEVLALA